MEVDLEIYSHLIKTGVLEGGFNNPEHKVQLEIRKVLLDKDTSILFENGIAFARYLIYIKRKLESMVWTSFAILIIISKFIYRMSSKVGFITRLMKDC